MGLDEKAKVRDKMEGDKIKIGIVVSEFNEVITKKLLEGAEKYLKEEGVDYEVFWVPGSLEIPVVAKAISEKFDAILSLGCIIKGETYHFDFVAKGTIDGIVRVSLDVVKPVIFGVLTVENLTQALERAGGKYGNKGYEWAENAVYMAKLIKKIKEGEAGKK